MLKLSNVSMVDGHIDNQKMTDDEIIKALECCITNDCAKCKAYDETNGEIVDCLHAICRNALDLINRQNEEIERLLKAINYKHCVYEKRVVTEAIKEFAEGLKDIICNKSDESLDNPDGSNYFIPDVLDDIDNLVKEMVGDSE